MKTVVSGQLSEISFRAALLCAVLLLPLCAFAATEYKRPTSTNTTTITVGVPSPCYTGTYDGPATTPTNLYSGKSGAGPVSSPSMSLQAAYSDFGSQAFTQQIYTGFSTSNSYSALTISLNSSKTVTSPGTAWAYYCTAGTSACSTTAADWTSFGTISTTASTLTATITGATLSNVEVVLCAASGATSSGVATLSAYDLWTTGTVGSSSTKKSYSYISQNKPRPGGLKAPLYKHHILLISKQTGNRGNFGIWRPKMRLLGRVKIAD
jgi:hypothetical protein